MRLKRFLLPLIAVASLGIAACGDDDNGGGGESDSIDLTAEADAVCIEASRELADLALARKSAPVDEETTVTLLEEYLPVQELTLADLQEIEPPADVGADYEQYLSLRQQAIDVRQEAIDASQSGDTKGFEAASAEIGKLVDEVQQAAEQLGFENCANILPDDDVAAVEAVETEIAASSDASDFCEGFLLPQALQQFYGSDDPQKCLDDPNSGKSAEVDVQEVTGVDGIFALAVVEFPEEEKAALRGPFEDTLYYVDGEWRLYSSGLAE